MAAIALTRLLMRPTVSSMTSAPDWEMHTDLWRYKRYSEIVSIAPK
jgi:hypothetical protein